MTVEDALQQLRYEIEEEGHCSYIHDEMMVAFECMEKQIPKKVVKKNPIAYSKTRDGKCHYDYDYHCPLCDKKLRNNLEHHCPCGQKLEWSDSE